jgi:hypothetical protein
MDIISEWPTITHLTLINSNNNNVLEALTHFTTPPYSATPHAQPHIITLSGCDEYCLCRMVGTRTIYGKPLSTLRLSAIFHALMSVDVKEKIEQRVKVEIIADMSKEVATGVWNR